MEQKLGGLYSFPVVLQSRDMWRGAGYDLGAATVRGRQLP